MTTRHTRRRRTATERAEAVERFLASDLSATAFCRQESVTMPTLLRWRREHASAATSPPMAFIEVVERKEEEPPSLTSGPLLTMTTPEGAVIEIADRAIAARAVDACFAGASR